MNIPIDHIIEIAKLAGTAIMKIYEQDFQVEMKADHSPLTLADQHANGIILEGLLKISNTIPIISEETKLTSYEVRRNWKRFWLVDPLDGTKEFVKRNGEFTVNIALMENGQPVLGVVYAPAKNILYAGSRADGCFMLNGNESRRTLTKGNNWRTLSKVNVVASRSHLSEETLAFVDELKKQGKQVEFVSSGSSLKFCLVAEGKADVYPRFGPTMEWDTAAGQAVVELAGGKVLNWQTGARLEYNKENLLNPFFIVEF